MSTKTAEGLESSLTSEDSIEQAIDSLVEAVDAPESAVSPFIELVEGMAHQLDETAQEAVQARERAHEAEARVEELEAELKEERETRAKESAQDRKRLHEVEERLDSVEEVDSSDTNPTPQVEKDGHTEPHTPLEQICSLPEEAVAVQLSANQRRARFVAGDIDQYASKVPAGYAITSGEISTVLRAGTDCDGRTQTVARVMDFLDRLGQDLVKIIKRRGTKRVILDEKLVEQIGQIDEQADHTSCYDTVGLEV